MQLFLAQNHAECWSVQFEMQVPTPIDGIEAIHHLEAGYILDVLQQSIRQVKLVCPSGDGIFWMIELSTAGVNPVIQDIFEHRDNVDVVEPAVIIPKDNGIILPFKMKPDEK